VLMCVEELNTANQNVQHSIFSLQKLVKKLQFISLCKIHLTVSSLFNECCARNCETYLMCLTV